MRFSEQFSAWVDPTSADLRGHLTRGLVVFDANALLDFYRIEPAARLQVFRALDAVRDRFWIPHQVALEFARNRARAAANRHSDLRKASISVRNAEKAALENLTTAIQGVLRLRNQTMTTRTWDPAAVKLDQDSLAERLEGVMQPALDELSTLKDEQDQSIRDLVKHDPVLELLDPVLSGRVGPAYDSTKLREVVDHATAFRFPNKIPPGYRDAGKATALAAAGDYILWRQLLDHVSGDPAIDKIAFVTNDTKADWWEKDADGNPVHPHPQLVQEVRDSGGASIAMCTLADFVSDLSDTLVLNVPSETMDQIRNVQETGPDGGRDPWPPSPPIRLFADDFRDMVGELLVDALGYKKVGDELAAETAGFDFLVEQPEDHLTERELVGVVVHFSLSQLSSLDVDRMVEQMRASGIRRGLIVSTAPPTPAARDLASANDIDIIDRTVLRPLIDMYLRSRRGG
ncbi:MULTISPECIES: PIN-like domain-containing protein [unclassified Saccharothrix]|uniref:PIN-like domain-containing protein n=1 Tax=unclassified Saccharothrix TaxID=2593673 RepID=UPI00307F7E2F